MGLRATRRLDDPNRSKALPNPLQKLFQFIFLLSALGTKTPAEGLKSSAGTVRGEFQPPGTAWRGVIPRPYTGGLVRNWWAFYNNGAISGVVTHKKFDGFLSTEHSRANWVDVLQDTDGSLSPFLDDAHEGLAILL